MADIAQRFPQNPLLTPSDIQPSRPGLESTCLLNPGVFRFNGKIWLLLNVATSSPPFPSHAAIAASQPPHSSRPLYSHTR